MRRLLPLALALLPLLIGADAPQSSKLAALENRGVGLMGRFDFDGATQVFADVLKLRDGADARTNLAIATLNRQREGDTAAAMKLIDKVLANAPDHLRARYVKGLLLLNGGDPATALQQFLFVADKDPRDPYAAYYVGQCLAGAGKHEEALVWYEKASSLDPALRSAYYGAFQSLQRLKRIDEAKQKLAAFQKLKDHLQARLVEFKYTRMGPKAEATVSSSSARGVANPATQPTTITYADPVPLPIRNADNYSWKNDGNITAADIDGDGTVDLFITAGDRNAVLLNRGGNFELVRDHPLSHTEDVNAALWGDYDNDGLVDVYLLRHGPNQLFRQVEKGKWKDVTEQTKTFGGNAETIGGAFFDADHDGDLDLFLVNDNAPNELLNNNGDGTFRAIGAESGVAGDGRPSRGVVVNDFDNDGDADLFVVKRKPPHELYFNDRFWKYHAPSGSDALLKTNFTGPVVAADRDADGQVELYADAQRWSPDEKGVWSASAATDESKAPPGTPVVFDSKSAPSMISIPPNHPPTISRPVSNNRHFLTLALTGKSKVADQMRSNASGVGVKVAVRVGPHWIAADTYPSASAPAGQSHQPLSIDLGDAAEADFVRLTWPEGLLQTELNLAAGLIHTIDETQRQTSSCPVLFAWNGTKYAFVTDVLGVGGIGFAVGREQYAPPRPRENVLLPENLLAPRGGRYELKLGEPMEEACYLDAASLIAYDLPPGWQITLDERMATGAPEPTGEPRFYRRSIVPTRATNDRGEDVIVAVVAADQRAAPPGDGDPRHIGRLRREHVLTLEFDAPIDGDGGAGEPILLIDGWVEYPYSQTMFAAWQSGAAYDAPTLEACDAAGQWHVVLDRFGYAAGMPRQMSVPIPREKLPPGGATKLRLRTTQEVYFDRVAVAFSESCPQAKRIQLPMSAARLGDVGFAKRTNFVQRRPHYDYASRSPLWDARHPEGFYTAFGPVGELIGPEADDAFAIFGPGEEAHLEFAAPTDTPPAGWTRRFVAQLAGWCKDMDFYTRDGGTLAPLPARDAATDESLRRRDALHERFNTRYRSGGGRMNVQQLIDRAIAHHSAGRLAEAEAIYREILAQNPDEPAALHLLGVASSQLGDKDAAVRLISRAIELRPGAAEFHSNLALVHLESNRPEQALRAASRSVELNPRDAGAQFILANALRDVGRLGDAVAGYRRVLHLQPNHDDAQRNLAQVLARTGQAPEAERMFRAIVARRPDWADVILDLADLLFTTGRKREAEPLYERLASLRPDWALGHISRGLMLAECGELEAACDAYRRAIELDPQLAGAYNNLGYALAQLGDTAGEERELRRALELQPDLPDAINNLGNCFRDQGRFDEALEQYLRGISIQADHARSRFNRALLMLLTGDWTNGWTEYEWRWIVFADQRRPFASPRWVDQQPLAGKTILVHAEQGLGDTMQFARYMPMLAERIDGARVVFECFPTLVKLMGQLPGVGQVVARGDTLPPVDFHVPLMSLPMSFGTQPDTIPWPGPYLHADSAAAESWKQRIEREAGGGVGKLRVGIVWAGDPINKMDRRRSCGLDRFVRLAGELGDRVAFFSLQKGEPAEHAKSAPPEMKLVDFTADLNDFSDTAALVANLDLVITVDTSVAHLAGAMGKPVWTMIMFNPDWRWMLGRLDSPWYPTMRLFRPRAAQDWDGVFEQVTAALRDRLGAARDTSAGG